MDRISLLKKIHKQASQPSLSEVRGLYSDDPNLTSNTSPGLDEIKRLYEEGGASDLDPNARQLSLRELRDAYNSDEQPSAEFGVDILSGRKTISQGMSDSSSDNTIERIQKLLIKHNYDLSNHGADGDFGDETRDAVLMFQENNNLNKSGKIDSRTMSVLLSSNPVKYSDRTPPSVSRKVNRDLSVSGTTKVSAQSLYSDLVGSISDKNLCIAMVANAIGESGLRINVNGDCGKYAKRKGSRALDTSLYPNVFHKPKRGGCCSFGLWQYNICGGLGNHLLEAYGVEPGPGSTDEEKIAVLTDYKKQVDFMISHVNRRARRHMNKGKSVDWWVDWFVRKVERPADMDGAVSRRRDIARGLNLA